MFKKGLSWLLALLMVVSLIPVSVLVTAFAEGAPVAMIGDTPYDSLSAANTDAQDGDTIELVADATIDSKLIVGKAITINGNGHKIIADSTASWNTHLLGVNSNQVSLNDIVLDCNKAAQGVNIYQADGIVFDNVAIINAGKGWAALTVNGSDLLIKTAFSALGNTIAVDVDKNSTAVAEDGVLFNTGGKKVQYSSGSVAKFDTVVDSNGEIYYQAILNDVEYCYDICNYGLSGVSGKTVKLLKDVKLSKTLSFSRTSTLDLNGHTLTIPEDKPLNVSYKFTIKGEGEIKGKIFLTQTGVNIYSKEEFDVVASTAGQIVIYFPQQGFYRAFAGLELPEVEITDISGTLTDEDPDLSYALNFSIKDLENLSEEYLENLLTAYGDWYVDYALTIEGLNDSSVSFNVDDVNADGYLAGQYDEFGPDWLTVPFGADKTVTVQNGETVYIMETAAELFGQSGLRFTLAEVAKIVQNFDCGMYFTPEFLVNNPDMKITLGLRVFYEENGEIVNSVYVAKDTFYAEDAANKVELPEVVITDIVDTLDIDDPYLSFALNFAVSDEDLERIENNVDGYGEKLFETYGNWFVDYVLAIEGLNDADVTFNANGNADGYLAGQYDAWSENWVSVPFEDVTIQNGDSLYIMEYAAKLMNQSGLRFTLAEVAEIVQNFDCGIFFSREFLDRNPNMKVTLGLQLFKEENGVKNCTIVLANDVFKAADVARPELPEVVVTDIKNTLTKNDPDLSYALNFAVKDMDKLNDAYLADLFYEYGNWYTDYVLTIEGLNDADVTFNANGNADGYLAGQYDEWSENWVSVPFEDVTIDNGQSLYIMEYAAKLMNQSGLRFTLAEVVEIVGNFDCGMYFTPEFLAANPNMKITLALKVFKEDASGAITNNIDVAKKVFTVSDAEVKLPEVVITDIKDQLTDSDPDLSYALNFAIKDSEKLSEKYLEALFNKYGNWYVDYVLTIEGLSAPSVSFNADGTADGYLAGQYDEWSLNWVSVPFEDVTINDGESLYIMETAASMLGESGLRFTLAEVAMIVQNFDCGMYFNPEFIAANPNMKITLGLEVFTEDASGNRLETIDVAKREFFAKDAADNVYDTYTVQDGTQIRLIEPWGLKVNFLLSKYGSVINHSALAEYGVYFVRESALEGLQPTINNIVAKGVYTPASVSDGNYLTAIYDKGLYTYEFSDAVYAVLFVKNSSGERFYYQTVANLSTLVNERKEDERYPEDERAVYSYMAELEKDIIAHRKTFDNLSIEPSFVPVTLSEYSVSNPTAYTAGGNRQGAAIRLLEPWGLRLHAMFLNENGTAVDYSTYSDFGAIVFVDKEGVFAQKDVVSLDDVLARNDAFVYSNANGHATAKSGIITAVYANDVYTYEMNTDIYVVFFLKDANGDCVFGDLFNNNIYKLMQDRVNPDLDGFTDLEKEVYADMIGLFETVTEYRNNH